MEENDTLDLRCHRLSGPMLLRELKDRLDQDTLRVDLTDNQITTECANFLAEFLQEPRCNVISLSISDTRMTVEACSTIFKVIGESPLLEFYADDNVIKPESLALLANSLSFSSPLQILSLVGCDISAEGVENLVKCLTETKNLRHLRLESNSMYETGVRALADTIESSSLVSIEIADNQIWQQGMSYFLDKVLSCYNLSVLDISYNAVDLSALSKVLMYNQNITHLAVSGCKVSENSVLPFIESIKRTHLHTLLMDGFNYDALPISWPAVQDIIFQKKIHFEAFYSSIINSEYIEDIRIGYLELDQINTLEQMLARDQRNRSVKISINDFGRTKDCWVLNFPAFSIDAPVDVLRWEGKLNVFNAEYFGKVLRYSLVNDRKLSKVDFSELKLNQDVFNKLIQSLLGQSLQLLDITGNNLPGACVDSLVHLLQEATVNELLLRGNNLNELDARKLLSFLRDSPERLPRTLEFDFRAQDGEQREHTCLSDVVAVLRDNLAINKLVIGGSVSVNDASSIIAALRFNTHLRQLELDSDLIKPYEGPDPPLDPKLVAQFADLARLLLRVLSEGCALISFRFDMLTETFAYEDEVMEPLNAALRKLDENGRGTK